MTEELKAFKRIKEAYINLAHKVGDKNGLGELNYAEKKDFDIVEEALKSIK